MKRLLPLLIFAMIANFSVAQSSMSKKMQKTEFNVKKDVKESTTAMMPIDIPSGVDGWQAPIVHENTMNYRSGLLSKIELGSSYNIYSVISGSTNSLSYNAELDALVFVHRQNAGEDGGSGVISFDVSTDGGATWDSSNKQVTPSLETAGGTAINGNRYPSGAIYNPAGNTDVANAKFVGIGPALWGNPNYGNGNGWGWEFVATANLDGTDASEAYFTTPQDSAAYIPYSLVNNADGSLWYANIKRETRTDAVDFDNQFWSPALATKLTFDADGGYAREVTEMPIDYIGSIDSFVLSPAIAFSPDGQTGYFVVSGIDADDNTETHPSVKPIVWKTTDAGANWVKQPRIQYQTQDSLIAWTLHIDGDGDGSSDPPGSGSARIPYMSQFDITVDAEGELHLFASMLSKSDSTQTQFGFIWTGEFATELFHFISDGENWRSYRVGGYYNEDAPIGTTAGAIDERIQASRSADGTHVFMTYAETFYTEDHEDARPNASPDINAYAHRVSDEYFAGPVSFGIEPGTEWIDFAFTDIAAEGFLHMTSPVAIENGENWDHELPIVYGVPSDLGDDLAEINYWYVRGAGFDDVDFTERPSLDATEDVEINSSTLKVQPNPASKNVNVSFELLEASKVAIDLFDMTGRQVLSTGSLDLSAGTHTQNITLGDLPQGTYLVRLQTVNQVATSKVVIK